MSEARKGKIARLPAALRKTLNERLRDGWTGEALCKWLNSLPEVRKSMLDNFGGEPVKPQNLSEWRGGGYLDWLRDEERVENVRALADLSYRLAEASNGNLSAGACAIAAGKIQELLECAGKDDVAKIVTALTGLRMAEIAASREANERRKLDQKDSELELETQKFQRATCELFLKWYDNEEAKRIAASPQESNVRIEKLRELMYGVDKDAPSAS